MDGIQSSHAPRKVTMHYVTGILIPKGFKHTLEADGTFHDGSNAVERKLPRTDLAKFFEAGHARAHADSIRGPGIFALEVEAREELAES